MIRTFQGIKPTIPKSCFVEATAAVIGDVVMGEDCSVWFNAVIRGDVHYIRIGDRTNVQDLCMLHVTHDTHPLIIGNEVTIGHHVVLHGCAIHDRVLVGMGAIIMDGAVIGEDSVVGAGALVVEGTIVPPKSLILGSPAKVKRPVTDKELAWIKESAENYVKYARPVYDRLREECGFQSVKVGKLESCESSYFQTFELLNFRTPIRTKQSGSPTSAVGYCLCSTRYGILWRWHQSAIQITSSVDVVTRPGSQVWACSDSRWIGRPVVLFEIAQDQMSRDQPARTTTAPDGETVPDRSIH